MILDVACTYTREHLNTRIVNSATAIALMLLLTVIQFFLQNFSKHIGIGLEILLNVCLLIELLEILLSQFKQTAFFLLYALWCLRLHFLQPLLQVRLKWFIIDLYVFKVRQRDWVSQLLKICDVILYNCRNFLCYYCSYFSLIYLIVLWWLLLQNKLRFTHQCLWLGRVELFSSELVFDQLLLVEFNVLSGDSLTACWSTLRDAWRHNQHLLLINDYPSFSFVDEKLPHLFASLLAKFLIELLVLPLFVLHLSELPLSPLVFLVFHFPLLVKSRHHWLQA